MDDEKFSALYYHACLTAIELENTAIAYLKKVRGGDDPDRTQASKILLSEHTAAVRSLRSRVDAGKDTSIDNTPRRVSANVREQYERARLYADEASANALNIELEQIRRLRMGGEITEEQAKTLRDEVYLMQTSFMEQ